MAVQTPITGSLRTSVAGDLRVEIARFTSVADADTYVSTISNIVGFSIEGSTSAPTLGMTFVNSATGGATVTFKVTSGPGLLVCLILWGY
jgi:hypothetical protein